VVFESVRPRRLSVWTGVARWEEPHHPGPWVRSNRHANPLSPTLQHKSGREWDTIRRTELLRGLRTGRNRLVEAVLRLAVADAGTPSETADLQAVLQADDPSDRVAERLAS
jgi:hypothetical protein